MKQACLFRSGGMTESSPGGRPEGLSRYGDDAGRVCVAPKQAFWSVVAGWLRKKALFTVNPNVGSFWRLGFTVNCAFGYIWLLPFITVFRVGYE